MTVEEFDDLVAKRDELKKIDSSIALIDDALKLDFGCGKDFVKVVTISANPPMRSKGDQGHLCGVVYVPKGVRKFLEGLRNDLIAEKESIVAKFGRVVPEFDQNGVKIDLQEGRIPQ